MTSDTTLLADSVLSPSPFAFGMPLNTTPSEWSNEDARMPHSLPDYTNSSPGTSVGRLSEPFDGSPSSSPPSDSYGPYSLSETYPSHNPWPLLDPPRQTLQDSIRIDTLTLPPTLPLASTSYSTTPPAHMYSGAHQQYVESFPFIPQMPPLSPGGQSPLSIYNPAYPTLPHTPPVLPGAHSPVVASPASLPPSSEVGSPGPFAGNHTEDGGARYTHREQSAMFKDSVHLPCARNWGAMIPQSMYRPHTNSDRRRYVEDVTLEAPIYFYTNSEVGTVCGISLSDALHSRVKRLLGRDETVFQDRGPSVSIRLEWPGYRQWSRQIPTKDFRSPPGPITKAKLAKNVAKCVQRFILERQNHGLEDDSDGRWRVGNNAPISFDNLVLVSIHHVSMGSWQPQLRFKLNPT